MSELINLMRGVEQAKEALDEAEQKRDKFLDPILELLGATGGCISSCHTGQNRIYITRSGSSRGCPWDDTYEFPLPIFTSQDPLKSASEYVTAAKVAKEKAERNSKLATIERLQKELGQ